LRASTRRAHFYDTWISGVNDYKITQDAPFVSTHPNQQHFSNLHLFAHTFVINMLLPTLLSLSLALPVLSAPLTSRSTETWSIPTMNVHFMGRDTGIPGNTWPEDRKFNTTLDFTLATPSAEVQCSANWKYQEVSTAEWACGDATGVSFHLSPTPAGVLADASWTLTITEKSDDG
jgi:hypothetical protein